MRERLEERERERREMERPLTCIPTDVRYRHAAPKPTASAMGGVPASNRDGDCAYVELWQMVGCWWVGGGAGKGNNNKGGGRNGMAKRVRRRLRPRLQLDAEVY